MHEHRSHARINAAKAYLRRWAPFWIHCTLTGLAAGLTIGIGILALHNPYLAPVWVVVLSASLRHLHSTRGTRILKTTARKALERGSAR